MNNKHISIYGDESINNNIVCYGICVFPTDLIQIAENLIKSIKKEFKIPESYFLHCNPLFYSKERERLNFGISLGDIENLYRRIANKFKTADMLCCYVDKREVKKDKEVIDWGNGAKTEIYFGDKELIHQCKNGAIIDVVRSRQEDEYDFYPDPDRDGRMRWNNKKKARVNDQGLNIIIPEGILKYRKDSNNNFTRAKEIKVNGAKPILIQIADFLAYSFAKASTVQQYDNKDFFIEMIKILNPVSRKIVFE